MDYQPVPNLLLEALAYLGRKTGGYAGPYLAERLQQRGVEDLSSFWTSYAPIKALSEELDACIEIPQRQTARLFANLPGFPYSPTGTYSIAFLLFYPVLNRYDGDFFALVDYMRTLSPEHTARHLMLSLDLSDDSDTADSSPVGSFMKGIQALDIPSDSKLTLVDSLHRYRTFLDEAAACLAPVLAALEARKEELQAALQPFSELVTSSGPEEYMRQTSSLSLPEDCGLRPFLFGLDTNLTVEPCPVQGQEALLVYSGILRQHILALLSRTQDAAASAYQAIKLLGDKTRFDILCFLRDRSAYGQELCDRFGLARNTIHHHMSKLSNAGLVTCKVDGNRVYYAVDKDAVERLLIQQRQLLIGGRHSFGNLA